MGLLERLGIRKSKVAMPDVKYVLKRRASNGGMAKVMELKAPVTIEDVYQHLEPGIYALHKYTRGQSGFEQMWQHEVLGEERQKAVTTEKKTSPFSGLRQFAEDIKSAQDDLNEAFTILGPMMGFKKEGESKTKSVVEQLKEAKEDLKTLQELFPPATTGAKEIPVRGDIPAWMVYAPQAVDILLDNVEKRLYKWDLIAPEKKEDTSTKEFINIPNRPETISAKNIENISSKVEDTDSVVVIPDKPEVDGVDKKSKTKKSKVKKVSIKGEDVKDGKK